MTKLQVLQVKIINAIDENTEKFTVTDDDIQAFLDFCEAFHVEDYMIDFIEKTPNFGFYHYMKEAADYSGGGIPEGQEDDDEDDDDDDDIEEM